MIQHPLIHGFLPYTKNIVVVTRRHLDVVRRRMFINPVCHKPDWCKVVSGIRFS